MADFRCAEKSKAVGPWKTDGSASATEQEASSLEGMLLVRTQKIIRAAQMRSSGLFVAVCVGGLTHSPHGSRCVFVRLGPRSRIGTRTVPAAPSASASNALRLLIAPLLLKVLKLAAVRITRQLAQ